MDGKFIAYYRVSTQRQGKSGLGLEAQRRAVDDYLNGGRWALVSEFTEAESGKTNDRPQLQAALAACRKHRAKLVIAKLDRLSRDPAIVDMLANAGVEFVAADNPHANKLTIRIMYAVAEHEREMISARTKAALAAAKRRGQRLGNPRIKSVAKLGNAAMEEHADRFARNVAPIIKDIQAHGATTLQQVADALNNRGIKTDRGGKWWPSTVSYIMRRC